MPSMTADLLFYHQFSLLTAEQKAAVLLVIQTFLGNKTGQQPAVAKPSASKKRGAYGSLKGKIIMAPDFDAPLDEMQPYMQ